MSDRNRMIMMTAIGFLAAAVVGLGVALFLTLKDDDESKTKFVDVTATQTVTNTVTAPSPTTTQQTTTTKTSSSSGEGFDDAGAAGRNYGMRHFSASSFESESVIPSRRDPDYALVTYFEDGTPVAVWVSKKSGKWLGIAGSENAEPAPSGLGIPSDIKYPFSESE